ncbi:MAG: GatB/YqeY domain-containing protein [Alphaproteobacteria bacterium]|nr:GatB/YqeY domain-containing protein [Alphaproteobacteria bacterium]
MVVLQCFLPKVLSDAELDTAIEAALVGLRADNSRLGKSAMGQVMAVLKAEYPGQIDMSRAVDLVRARL